MKRFLKEPVLHFIIIGTLLFAAHSLLNRQRKSEDPYTISFEEREIAPAVENFTRNNSREPSPEELKELVDLYILEEVYFREAIALGMNENDPAVKRLLALRFQEFMKDQMEAYSPGEGSLENYFKKNPSKFSASAEDKSGQVVLAEWRKEHRVELKETKIKELKAKYRVVPDSRELQLVEAAEAE